MQVSISKLTVAAMTAVTMPLTNAEDIMTYHGLSHASVDVGSDFSVGKWQNWQGNYWVLEHRTGIIHYSDSLKGVREWIKLCRDALAEERKAKYEALNYKQKPIWDLAVELTGQGFEVWLAEQGHYGHYTDHKGERVVSFQYDMTGIRYFGNYTSRHCGTGWGLHGGTFRQMLDAMPPHWATKGEKVSMTTLKQQNERYASSKHTRFLP